MKKEIQIVAFAVPYPPNFGGIIDIFHKIRCLHNAGFEITLHCFTYKNFKEQDDLKKYCKSIYYYKRDTSFINQFLLIPYIVQSRKNMLLINRLYENKSPILFEGLHSCFYLNDPKLKHHFKIFRESNIEHFYYRELAKASRSILNKIFYYVESLKLEIYEQKLKSADLMLVVSESETNYFQNKFPNNKVVYLPSFHEFDAISSKPGNGNYVLYHGNLSVEENQFAVQYLIENVFSKIDFQCVIAGLNPPDFLTKLISNYPNIELKANVFSAEMNDLIENAHIHVMYTEQDTGLKLKLLNALFKGRFCLVNQKMINGTSLKNSVEIANSSTEFIEKIKLLMPKAFELNAKRISELTLFENRNKTEILEKLILGKD